MKTEDILNKRTGIGATIGGLIGFFLGGGPLTGGIGAVVGGAIANVAQPTHKGVMTPKRSIIYKAAITSTKDPDELRRLADAFEAENLKPWAEMLRKRAALRELPPDIREARKNVYRKALCSDSPEEIETAAKLFENEGAADAAKGLRDHADAVKAAHAAGMSTKPMADGKMIEKFAEKLMKAIVSFGPDSDHAQSAAANFVAARGMQPTPQNVRETIAACAAEMNIAEPAAVAPEGDSSASSATPEGQGTPEDAPVDASAGAATAASEDAAGAASQGIPEPPPSGTVVVDDSPAAAPAE